MTELAQQARIWQRVRQEKEPEVSVPEERLCLWLAEAMGRRGSFLAMARQAPGQKAALCRLAQLERESVRRLAALRLLLYGRRAEVLPAAAEGVSRYGVALRRVYGACAAAGRSFEEGAGRWPHQADALRRLAALKSCQCALLERMV